MPTAAPPSAPDDKKNEEKKGPEEGKNKKEGAGEKNNKSSEGEEVQKQRKDVSDKVGAVVPDAISANGSARSLLEYKSIPRLPFKTIGKAALGTAVIFNPVVAASVIVPTKAWSGIKRIPPFSWVHRAGVAAVNGVKSVGTSAMEHVVRPIAETATWPVRATAVLGYNAGVGVAKLLGRLGAFTRDLFVHDEGESLNIMEKVVMFFGSLPNRTIKLVEAVVPKIMGIFPELAKRPIRSMMLLALAAGGIGTMTALGTEILALLGASTSLITSLSKLFQAAAAWLI